MFFHQNKHSVGYKYVYLSKTNLLKCETNIIMHAKILFNVILNWRGAEGKPLGCYKSYYQC